MGTKERTVLIHEGLRALIERESAKRLARQAGSQGELEEIAGDMELGISG